MRNFLILSLVAVLAMPASADHCASWSTSNPDIDTGLVAGAPQFYVDNDPSPAGTYLFSIWIYQESNGIAGLQRGDEVVDNTCHGMIPSDTIIF